MKRKTPKLSAKEAITVTIPTIKTSAGLLTTTKSFLEKDLARIADFTPIYAQNAKLLNERMSEIMLAPAFSIASGYQNYFNSIKKLQSEMLAPSLRISELLKPLTESSKVFESLALSQTIIAKQLAGLVIDLPLSGYLKTLSASSSFELTLNKFTSTKALPANYVLGGTAVETIQHERVGLKISAGFEMRLSSIESILSENTSRLDYLIEKEEKHTELTKELIEYIKTTGSPLARIESISYNHTSTEIILNDIKIKLRANTNMSSICRVLLASKEAMQKTWEMEDIVEELGEATSDKDWHRTIYDAVSELNAKILIATKGGVSEFFLTTMHTVTVNPKYVS
jgi:hypothetical protein